jgi:hypothetical protein
VIAARVRLALWMVLLALLAHAAPVSAESKVDAFARVVVEETALRSGPGVAHRVLYTAHRGETFVIDARQGNDFWLKLVIPDGRSGWVLGDTVQPIAIRQDAPERPRTAGWLAPPPLAEARGGLAILGGVLASGAQGTAYGYLELKPAFVLAPTVAFEPYVGMALTTNGNQLLYGAAFTVHLAPDWAIEPYASLGLGALSSFPNNDQFVLKKETVWAARAGGGLLMALRGRVLVRFELSNLTLFTEDSYRNAQLFTGGCGVYF